MQFSDALEELKKGKIITNRKWNGKGMYLWYVPPHKVDIKDYRCRGGPDDPTPREIEQGYVDILGHIDMMTADGKRLIGWLASQYDLQSDAWEILE